MRRLSQQQFYELADQYLRKELNDTDRLAFEAFCAENPSFSAQLSQHKEFISHMQATSRRMDFKSQLALSAKEFRKTQAKELKIAKQAQLSTAADADTKESQLPGETKVISILNRYKINSFIAAAAVAIVAVFSTLWVSGYYKTLEKTSSNYSALRREMNTVRKNVNAHNVALRNINSKKDADVSSSHYGATGFMVTNDGYVVTNFHVVNGADSVYLQNNKGDSFKASIVYTDADKDLAILFIKDHNFKGSKNLPYTFKSAASELGEDIYTIGFPRDEAVYGQGYLSSATGYAGDTVSYQISIPVNPGNSGGPVLDNRGNVIGIISGKQTGIDGAAFAIKTQTLLSALKDIPTDSLKTKIVLNKKNNLKGLPRTEQVKHLRDYIYMVKVY